MYDCDVQQVKNRLALWNQAFNQYLRVEPLDTQSIKRSIALMQLHKHYIRLGLAIPDDPNRRKPVSWDMYLDEFDEMVECARQATALATCTTTTNTNVPQFHMDMGVVPILFAVVARCRDPFIRRKAIHVMTSTSVQEGFWNSMLTARVAQRLVDVEESGLVVLKASDIPPQRRIRTVLVSILTEKTAVIRYGRDGNLHVRAEEELKLNW